MPSPERIYLLADMHLKPLDAPSAAARDLAVKENERLARFLSGIDGQAGSMVLLGDAFNFWFERKSHVVGDYGAALSLFRLAAEKGLNIHHVSGNRDYAVGEGLGFDPATRYPGFLRLKRGFTVSRLCDYGIEPHGHRHRVHQAGKTVAFVHGDSLCGKDRWFMLLRRLLQGWPGRLTMRYAPWSLLEMVVAGQQGRTRVRGGGSRNAAATLDEAEIRREMAMGADLLVCGHIHAGYEKEFEVAGRVCRLTALPAWLDGWYGVLEDGAIRVEEFH